MQLVYSVYAVKQQNSSSVLLNPFLLIQLPKSIIIPQTCPLGCFQFNILPVIYTIYIAIKTCGSFVKVPGDTSSFFLPRTAKPHAERAAAPAGRGAPPDAASALQNGRLGGSRGPAGYSPHSSPSRQAKTPPPRCCYCRHSRPHAGPAASRHPGKPLAETAGEKQSATASVAHRAQPSRRPPASARHAARLLPRPERPRSRPWQPRDP